MSSLMCVYLPPQDKLENHASFPGLFVIFVLKKTYVWIGCLQYTDGLIQ